MKIILITEAGLNKLTIESEISWLIETFKKLNVRSYIFNLDNGKSSLANRITIPSLIEIGGNPENILLYYYEGKNVNFEYLIEKVKCKKILRIVSLNGGHSSISKNIEVVRDLVEKGGFREIHAMNGRVLDLLQRDKMTLDYGAMKHIPCWVENRICEFLPNMDVVESRVSNKRKRCLFIGIIEDVDISEFILGVIQQVLLRTTENVIFTIMISADCKETALYNDFKNELYYLKLENYVEIVVNKNEDILKSYMLSSDLYYSTKSEFEIDLNIVHGLKLNLAMLHRAARLPFKKLLVVGATDLNLVSNAFVIILDDQDVRLSLVAYNKANYDRLTKASYKEHLSDVLENIV